MTIERWIPSESNLSTEESLDVLAEKIFEIEERIADRSALEVITGFTINQAGLGAFSGQGTIPTESDSRKLALALIKIRQVAGSGDFDLTVTGGRENAEYPVSLQQDNIIYEILPLKFPGNFSLTFDYSGTVNVAPYQVDIDVLVISL